MDKYREDEVVLCIKNEFEEPDYHVGEAYTIKGVSMVDGNVIYSVIDQDGVLSHTMDKFMSFNPPKFPKKPEGYEKGESKMDIIVALKEAAKSDEEKKVFNELIEMIICLDKHKNLRGNN
jgi:hypothetical protein